MRLFMIIARIHIDEGFIGLSCVAFVAKESQFWDYIFEFIYCIWSLLSWSVSCIQLGHIHFGIQPARKTFDCSFQVFLLEHSSQFDIPFGVQSVKTRSQLSTFLSCMNKKGSHTCRCRCSVWSYDVCIQMSLSAPHVLCEAKCPCQNKVPGYSQWRW